MGEMENKVGNLILLNWRIV